MTIIHRIERDAINYAPLSSKNTDLNSWYTTQAK